MLTAAAMRKLRIVVLEGQARHVAEVLGRLGVLHLKSSVEEGEGRLEPERLEQRVARCRDLTGRLEGLLTRLGFQEEAAAAPPSGPAASLHEIEALVQTVEARLAEKADQLDAAEQAFSDTEEIIDTLTPLRTLRSPLERLAQSDLLEMRTGVLAPEQMGTLRTGMPDGVLLVPLEEGEAGPEQPVYLLALSSRRRRFAMETVLEEHDFAEQHLPAWQGRTPAELYEEAVRRRRELADRTTALRGELQALAEPYGQALRDAATSLSVQLKLTEAEQAFGTTWATVVISGWAPRARVEEVRQAVLRATDGQAVVEASPPDREDIEQGRVPTYMEHPAFLAPFARLVRGYGVASYTEIEPTVMFAATFLLMFGLMFGDLGHGLCLLVIGLLVRKLARSDAVRDAGHVIAACGGASMLFGTFVQGALFGKSLAEMGFPFTLDFEPIRFEGGGANDNVMRYLALALTLGVVLISLGAILNVVNRLRRGDYEGSLLGPFGVTGIVLYWGLLGLAAKSVVAGLGAADVWLAAAVVGLPLVVLVLHEPLRELLLARRRSRLSAGSVAMSLFEGLASGMEALMLYLSNTFSFLRVAAFALSHAALCFTIFVIQRMVSGLPGGMLWSAAIFVVGTALIIGLEGFIVAIQILRLEYYEFFSKFFQADGFRYEPFRLE